MPDLYLHVNRFINMNDIVYQFTCSSNFAFTACSIESIFNNQTHDHIRYFKEVCYHTNGVCDPQICTCSNDCMAFTWNITVKPQLILASPICGCVSRIGADGRTYFATILTNLTSKGK